MLSFNQLQKQVAARFSDSQTIEENVIRFVRKLEDRPFAVCYLALDPELPGDEDELAKYQDRVVGGLYFEGAKSLQWSNYLYFITSAQRLATAKVQRAKEWIENNRSYARKFVVSEKQVDAILAPPVATPEGKNARANVISVWTEVLQANGLDRAIWAAAVVHRARSTRTSLMSMSNGQIFIGVLLRGGGIRHRGAFGIP